MRVLESKASKDPKINKNKIKIELNANDIIILQNAVNMQLESGKYDPDDLKYKEKFDHVKQELHEAWKLLYPS